MKLPAFHKRLPKSSLLISATVLLAVSFFSAWFFRSKPSVEQQVTLLERYIHTQQKEAAVVLSDTVLLRHLIAHAESRSEFERVYEKKFGLFVFAETLSENQDLLFWNSQEILQPTPDFSSPDRVYFQQLLNGYYVMHKKKIALAGISSNLVAYALIPVLNQYYLETENSQTRFAHNADAVRRIAIADRVTEFPVRSVDGTVLFYVTQATEAGARHTDTVTVILRLLALFLLLAYGHMAAEGVRRRRGPAQAVVFLFALLVVVRLALFYFPQLFSLRQINLFDPQFYGADSFNRSLGDLLLSALFLCWLMVFAWICFGPRRNTPVPLRGTALLVAGLAAVAVFIYATFLLASVVHNLVTASKISFDVTNFFSLSVNSGFGFVALAMLTLSYYYFTRLLFRLVRQALPDLLYQCLAVAVVGLTYLTFHFGNLQVIFHLPVLVWLVFYSLLLSQEGLIINRIRMTVAGILFWIFVFSASLAMLIMQGNHQKEWEERKAIAEKYERLTDPTKERLLRVALAYLNNNFLSTNFNRFYREPENQWFRDSIVNSNSLGYASAYFTNFFVFDSSRRAVNNTDRRSFEELNNILTTQSKPTGIPNLFYYETAYDQFVYITKSAVQDENKAMMGYVFIVAAPKQFQNTDALYPNLFVRTGSDPEAGSQYSYAIYKKRKLRSHSPQYSFATDINASDVPRQEFAKRQNGDFDELWYNAGNQKLVVVAKKKDSLIEGITLFSYLFCSFLFLVALIRVAQFAVRTARHKRLEDVFARMNIRTQIHGTIIFVSALSFLIIGVATISFFIDRYTRNNVDRLGRISSGTVNEMNKRVMEEHLLVNNALNFSDSASAQVLRNVVREIADVHGVIVNLYDLSGTLQVTSDENIYKRGVLSTRMHPSAYYQLRPLHAVQKVQEEKVGPLNYLSIYTALRNDSADTYAYLNIPSFNSQIELNQEISNFLVTIINLNAFIILLAGVVALFITNRITNSFSVISEKMRAITLGAANEEVVWTKNDEIGELVTQYNKMVRQLEQSAEALARSEREGAWREMARQVAHEIKNPLTPMKLSIQYLQRAIQTNQPNVQELTGNVANTLIEQIEHLSKIASDFSQFAAIGRKRIERIDLHSVLGALVDLYASNPKMEVRWQPLPEALWMNADKTQLNRLFTNLLTNAVDACSEQRKCVVAISEKREGRTVVVSVADNGEGIAPETQSRIFMPNFTTKTSGTGLGLAMCKTIADQAGGAIWFETKEGVGTTFYVRLPVVE